LAKKKTIRLFSWNVNGLRACAKKGFLDVLESSDAVEQERLAAVLAVLGRADLDADPSLLAGLEDEAVESLIAVEIAHLIELAGHITTLPRPGIVPRRAHGGKQAK